MHLTPTQEKFQQDVTDAVLAMGGMQTKSHAFPLTMNTKAGVLRTKPTFDGIECQFDEPARAHAYGIPCHRMKGTWKFDLPLGSIDNPDACSALVDQWKAAVQPLLTR